MTLSAEQQDKLTSVFAADGRVHLAVLFGSQATGRATDASDVDIGIIFRGELPLGEELDLAAKLESVANKALDLVRLDTGDALVGREVATSGRCLFEASPGAFAAYRARAMSEWIDFDEVVAPHRAAFVRRLVTR